MCAVSTNFYRNIRLVNVSFVFSRRLWLLATASSWYKMFNDLQFQTQHQTKCQIGYKENDEALQKFTNSRKKIPVCKYELALNRCRHGIQNLFRELSCHRSSAFAWEVLNHFHWSHLPEWTHTDTRWANVPMMSMGANMRVREKKTTITSQFEMRSAIPCRMRTCKCGKWTNVSSTQHTHTHTPAQLECIQRHFTHEHCREKSAISDHTPHVFIEYVHALKWSQHFGRNVRIAIPCT